MQVLERLGREEEALDVCGEALGFDPSDPLTYPLRLEMARLLAARGDKPEARAFLLENMERFPDIGDERVRKQAISLLKELEDKP